ncbi:MAG: cellulose biosynthesis cyclic di-GMP-binding regulatory protein BcsB [Vampirovibrio sp.]|nr:cellulose biosynthesis cyclic di-GMP-binding regulatory protein BcsB [Vampirovibrio sp.]
MNITLQKRFLWLFSLLIVAFQLVWSCFGCGWITVAPAVAATKAVSLTFFDIEDVILLPTVSSQRVIPFTVPKTWQLQSGSKLQVQFQHSDALIPGSHLRILINEQPVKTIPLTHNNAGKTVVDIPLPIAKLREHNTLAFQVEQHYTHKCEDPLDASLWTQVLGESRLTFQYNTKPPVADLSQFPYPVVDPTDYSPSKVHYLLPASPALQDIQAMAYLNTHLAQFAHDHEVSADITLGNSPQKLPGGQTHLMVIGTPAQNKHVKMLLTPQSPYRVENGQWIHGKTKTVVSDETGLVFYALNPKNPHQLVTVVTGNTPQGVFKAAQYLTALPRTDAFKGGFLSVNPSWSPPTSAINSAAPYIEFDSRMFSELGFSTQTVQSINAPPITYEIPVVTKIDGKNANLTLSLQYSYSPELNPRFSSLELRLNDRSIANIPLTNPKGEKSLSQNIQLPAELLQPQNNLVAQFHLMPDKYGYCVDTYKDDTWGTIHESSAVLVGGQPTPRLPDIGLLNKTGFPYTRFSNFQSTTMALPQDPQQVTLKTLLATTTRLGRSRVGDSPLQLKVVQAQQNLPTEGDVIVFYNPAANEENMRPSVNGPGYSLSWPELGIKQYNQPDGLDWRIQDVGTGGYLAQGLLPNNNRIVSYFWSTNSPTLSHISNFLNHDRYFEMLTSGGLKQLPPVGYQLNSILSQGEQTPAGWPWWGIALTALAVFLIAGVVGQRLGGK